MPLTPEEIVKKRFPVVTGRGYKRGDVDVFLADVAEDYSAAIQKIASAASGAPVSDDDVAEQVGEILRAARRAADRMKEQAQLQAQRLTEKAEERVRELQQEAEAVQAEAEQVRAEAKRTAHADAARVVKEAEWQAQELISGAHQRREEILAEAERRHATLLQDERELRDRIDTLARLVSKVRDQFQSRQEIDLTETEVADDQGHVPANAGQEAPDAEIRELQERLPGASGPEEGKQS